jgi:asparagine synthase (glutamine-hydrolysing)
MCGISGVFGRPDGETVKAMLGALAHRGPDDEFSVTGMNYALGTRRLAIVGVGDGRQPIANEAGTIWAAQNGELYNYPEVRRHLLAAGHQLHTHCDTEILPHLFEEYGTSLPEKIDGMFAVAVWDTENKTGLLARDRMGKKPLYYYRDGDALYFASEIKSLLLVPGFKRRINLEALHHFLSFKHVPSPMTIFEGISMLPPAHSLIYAPGKGIEIRRYWDVDFGPSKFADAPEEELVERLLTLLRQGVKRRLMSDVPIGFFLSGGIDSSLSTALAAETSPDPIKTFTLTYGNDSTTAGKEQDRRWARWTAEKYGTEHYEESVDFSNFPENLRRIIACFDEPFSGTISTYLLAGLIAKHVKVAVSGDGADELFGSYLSHRLAQPLANFPEYQRTSNASLIRPFDVGQADYLADLYEDEDWKWRAKLFVYGDDEKRNLYSPDVAAQMALYSSRERLRHDFSALTARDPLNRILEGEFRTIFPDQVLAFVDRLSMAHSLEVRTAFLDTDFVTFIAGLPGNLKIKDGETKYLLKKAALKYFPEEMVYRKKEGFLMPITEWLLGDLENYVRETLSAERLGHHGIFNSGRVKELVDSLYVNRHSGDYRQVNKVFALVVFQEWYDLYMS